MYYLFPRERRRERETEKGDLRRGGGGDQRAITAAAPIIISATPLLVDSCHYDAIVINNKWRERGE